MSSINSILDETALPEKTYNLLDKEEEKTSFTSSAAWFAALLVMLALYAAILWAHVSPATIHPDANGYWAQGSLIIETGSSYQKSQSDAQYLGMHWLLEPTKEIFVSRYPPGFPLVIGLVQKYWGWEATMLISPVLSILTLIGVYAIVKRLTHSGGWGLLAALALAVNPAYMNHSLEQISHMPVAFEIVWGFYFLLRWSRSGKLIWIFLAGLILGCIPSTRYADSIVALGVIVFMLLHLKKFPKLWKHFVVAFIAVMIPVTPLLIRNQIALGGFWKSGYSLTNESTGFDWQNFNQHALGYLQMLQGSGLGMMFALGTLGMFWMLCTRKYRNYALLTIVATVPFLVTYMAYYWAAGVGGGGPGGGGGGPGGGNVAGAMRFLVPVVPIFIITGAWMLAESLKSSSTIAKVIVPIVLLAMQVTMYGSSGLQEMRNDYERRNLLAIATKGIDSVAKKDDVIIGNNALLQQIDFVRKWKVADPSLFTGRGGGPGGGGGGGGRPGGGGMGGGPGGFGMGPGGMDQSDQPSPMQKIKREYQQKLYPRDTPAEITQSELKFHNDVLRWAGSKDVYVVGASMDEINEMFPTYDKEKLEIVKRIPTPEAPPEPVNQQGNRRGGFGGGFGGGPGNFGPGGGMGGGPGGMGGNQGGGRRGGGGPFGNFITPGQDILIAKLVRPTDSKPVTTSPATTQSVK